MPQTALASCPDVSTRSTPSPTNICQLSNTKVIVLISGPHWKLAHKGYRPVILTVQCARRAYTYTVEIQWPTLTAQVVLGGGQIIQRLAKHTSRLASGSHNTSKARWKVTLNLYRPQGSSKARIFLPWPHDFVLYIHLASHQKWRSKMSIGTTTDTLSRVIQNPCHHIVSHESASRTLDKIQILRPAAGGMFF